MTWKNIPGNLSQISVGDAAHVWGVNTQGHIYRRVNEKWEQVQGGLSSVSVGYDGTVWGVNSAGNIYHYLEQEKKWESIPGSLSQISVGDAARVWGVDVQGNVYHLENVNKDKPDKPDKWTCQLITGASLKSVSVGSDGAVRGVDSNGTIYRYLGANEWETEKISGGLSQISVGNAGTIWGVDSQGKVYQTEKPKEPSATWQQVTGPTLKCVSVGDDGTVWGVDSNSKIYRLHPTINDALSANYDLEKGTSVLSRAEWIKLQGFTAYSIYENPTTEEKMRLKLGLKKDALLEEEFSNTVKSYEKLKGYCQSFEDEIKPGTVGLADDIVQYQRRVDSVYDALIRALDDYDLEGEETDDIKAKLENLAKEWAKDIPSDKAEHIKGRFQKYIERLLEEAKVRSARATELGKKLKSFEDNLKDSQSDFKVHRDTYALKFEGENTELEELKLDIKTQQEKIDKAQKKDSDETIVLSTSPFYLLIPFFGPFIMAGVLLGVGIDMGVEREELKGKKKRMDELQSKQTSYENFMALYDTGKTLTDKTVNDIGKVIPLVDKLANAWGRLASDLNDLVRDDVVDGKPVKGALILANEEALEQDWAFSALDLDTAKKTWKDLATKADHYRQNAYLQEWI